MPHTAKKTNQQQDKSVYSIRDPSLLISLHSEQATAHFLISSFFATSFPPITMNSSFRFCLLIVSLLLAATSAFMPVNHRRGVTSTTRMFAASVTMSGPAVLEKESVRASGPAVLERPQVEERTDWDPTKERRRQGNEAWEVRIYNDGLNTREHVARSLVQVTGLSEFAAYQTMMQAHQNGIASVGRWVFEVAEMYHDELKRNGIVCDIIPVDEGS